MEGIVEFELRASLIGASLRIKRKGGSELITVKRPFYKDVLEVHWFDRDFRIDRKGILMREARIYKENKFFGLVKERFGIMSHFDVFLGKTKILDIHEKDMVISQEFKVLKKNKEVGLLRPIGIYVPLLSNIGKGLSGFYHGLNRQEEEILINTILALGV